MRPIPMTALVFALAGLTLFYPAQSRAGAQHDTAAPVEAVTTQLPRTARPTHYALEITPHADTLTFDAKAAIDIAVLQSTDRIVLQAAKLRIGKSTLTQGKSRKPQIAKLNLDAEAQTATFAFDKPLAPGNYVLTIDYSGAINTQVGGLFAADYASPHGQRRALLTQFQPADARSVIPCWDEPNFKATFDLAVTVPATQLAVSNMPVATSRVVAGGLKRVVFQRSPRMSTYLLFLAVGDFGRATVAADHNTEIGVVAQAGKLDQAQFALESTRSILHQYNHYFGVSYPLPKLDSVAAPARFNAAMENWGAILSAEGYVLLDPALSDSNSKQRMFGIAAHEIAHQWFGNLVTMAWWDDLWLNEGFANWMATRTTQTLHPEWDTDNILAARRSRSAMQRDAAATTHPVVQHIATVEQADQAFDEITYDKGEAVIAMLEDYIGADQWRDGVRRYMRQHRYGNTTTNDLWQQFDAVAPGKQFLQIAHDFTQQPGVPLIQVSTTCNAGSTTVSLQQREYTLDRPDKAPLRWHVPVVLRGAGGTQTRVLVEGSAQVHVPGCSVPVVVNAGQNGYYRTLYAPSHFKRLSEGFSTLRVVDQLGVLMDASALAATGLQHEAELLDLIDGVPAGASPALWNVVAATFGDIDALFDGDTAPQAAWRRYALSRLTPAFARLGWDAQADEPSQNKKAREQLISALSAMGDPSVIAEARSRFSAVHSNPNALPPEQRKTVLNIVAQHADAATWEALHAMASKETTAALRDQYYGLLASAQDPALAQRALELALTNEPGTATGVRMLLAVSGQHPELALDFAIAHRQQVDALSGGASDSGFYPRLVGNSANPQTADKLKAYADTYLKPDARGNAQTAINAIQTRAKARERRAPEITAWLRARRG
ncbi:M1 family metallopeptidase [Xanthomonas campestris pv. trichodesmae]|uniref:Aminopeptidase n=2 Tax=Xanthomonas citri TaxID=346 RepID=A0AB33CLM6_XANCI|nr:M1 family metallopeptidase [Xanthomonas citri]ASK93229.1 aminopeptidase [Xanthomonas citri pv. vignicola]MBV6780514.1 M1 family metallopeptidase [Xanthomonas campestris pv. trichodesmae]MBZ3918940.1 aminopeptidase [Xanthomonas campestris pv. trichodesmae]MBZ3924363.1 aminopeptidase [Xanthomonas citri pv. sesbaniae]